MSTMMTGSTIEQYKIARFVKIVVEYSTKLLVDMIIAPYIKNVFLVRFQQYYIDRYSDAEADTGFVRL